MEADPQNEQSKNSYALSLQNRANLLRKIGARAGALALYREALGIFQQLLSLDPQSPAQQKSCAETAAAIGEIAAVNGGK
jgi:tetratricopeptide (TPR) repeat protein